MKTTFFQSTTIGLASAAFLSGNLHAIERPSEEKPNALPAAVLPQGLATPKTARPIENQSTWLGVFTEAISDDLAFHLKLDSGVIIRVVDPTSPAAEAGLKERDVILKVGTLAVKNRDQVKAAIVAREPGEETDLSILRRGEILNLKVSLGKREFIPPMPKGQLLDLDAEELNFVPNRLDSEDFALLRKELLKKVEEALNAAPDMRGAQAPLHFDDLKLGIQNTGSFMLSDANGKVEMNVENGERTVKVSDAEGNVLFEGPYTTDLDKEALPEEYRARIDMIDTEKNGLDFRFHPERAELPELEEKGE